MARDDNLAAKEYGKLSKFRRRGYVRVGEVKSLTHYLSLPNGDDTMMVYNGTYRSINTSPWYPHVALPMIVSTLCDVEKGAFTEYLDIRYMLFNFIISEEVIPFFGFNVNFFLK